MVNSLDKRLCLSHNSEIYDFFTARAGHTNYDPKCCTDVHEDIICKFFFRGDVTSFKGLLAGIVFTCAGKFIMIFAVEILPVCMGGGPGGVKTTSGANFLSSCRHRATLLKVSLPTYQVKPNIP